MGFWDWLTGEGKTEHTDPTPLPYPTPEDAAAARDYKQRFGNVNEYPLNEGMVLPFEEAKSRLKSGAAISTTPSTIRDPTRDQYYAEQLAAQRTALAYLGYEPDATVVTPESGRSMTIAGRYTPKDDRVWTNLGSPGTLPHEATHRGLALLRRAGVPQGDFPIDEESFVRAYMERYYPGRSTESNRNTLSKLGFTPEEIDKTEGVQLDKAGAESAKNPNVRKSMDKLNDEANKLIAKRLIERQGGVFSKGGVVKRQAIKTNFTTRPPDVDDEDDESMPPNNADDSNLAPDDESPDEEMNVPEPFWLDRPPVHQAQAGGRVPESERFKEWREMLKNTTPNEGWMEANPYLDPDAQWKERGYMEPPTESRGHLVDPDEVEAAKERAETRKRHDRGEFNRGYQQGGEVQPYGDTLQRLKQQYPAIANYDWSLIDSTKKPDTQGHMEFYAPDERDNPTPGRPTIEVFDPHLKDQWLDQAILGDMLHHLPSVDPEWKTMRDQFHRSLTPDQLGVDHRAFADEHDPRSFKDWMEQSRLDAYLRGYITPDEANEWKDVYNDDQRRQLQVMKDYLSRPRRAINTGP